MRFLIGVKRQSSDAAAALLGQRRPIGTLTAPREPPAACRSPKQPRPLCGDEN
jgi:hypothetical protein